MRSDYDENLLLAYVEGELSPADRDVVERWMADDPQLRRLVDGMAADRDALRRAPQPEPPAWIMEEVDRNLERSMLLDAGVAEQTAKVEHHRHVLRRIGGVSAIAALLLVTAGIVVWSVVGLPTGSDTPATTGGVAMDAQPPDELPPPEVSQTEPSPSVASTTTERAEPTLQRQVTQPSDVAAESDQVEQLDDQFAAKVMEEQPPVASGEAATAAPSALGRVAGRSAEADSAGGLQVAVEDQPTAAAAVRFASPPAAAAEPETLSPPAGIVILTRDMDRSTQQLNDIVSNIAYAELAPDAAPEMARLAAVSPPVQYTLRLPVDQVSNIVTQLHNAPDGYQRIELVPAEPTVEEPMDRQRYDSLRRNWPSFAPDYRNILRRQIPAEPAQEQADETAGVLEIPVTIQQQPPEEDPPVPAAPADPAE